MNSSYFSRFAPRGRVPSAVVALAAGIVACGQHRTVSTPGVAAAEYEVAIERGRNIVRPLVRRGSGVAVAVGVGGRVVWSEGFGRTARAGGAAVSSDMPFRVYSMMKPVTAVLALQSAARGEVDLRKSVRHVILSLPGHYEPVVPLQLLTHTAGVRHYRDISEASLVEHCATATAALPLFIADPLVSEPGQKQSYSTWGFVLASAVLEQAAGMPFDSLLRVRILEPAGMTSTHLERVASAGSAVRYYDVDADGRTTETPPLDNSCKMGGGGFLSSVEDMVRFHNAVLRGELVPLGAVRKLLGDREELVGGGSGPGGESVFRIDLSSETSIVIVSNTSGLEQRMALERARGLLAAIFAPQP